LLINKDAPMAPSFLDLYNSFVPADTEQEVPVVPIKESTTEKNEWSDIADVLREHNIPVTEPKVETVAFIPTPVINFIEEVTNTYLPTDFEPASKDAEYISRALELEAKLIESQEIIEEQRAKLERDTIKEQIKELEAKLAKLDNKTAIFSENVDEQKQNLLEHVDKHVVDLIEEKKNDNISNDVRRYIDNKLIGLTNEIHRQMRIMVDYVGGGGSNAVQLAAGGTINGNLNVTGQYLSGGVSLFSVVSGTPGHEYLRTFTDPVSSSSDFLIFNVDGVNCAVQTWKY
jgi:hypothetical protein